MCVCVYVCVCVCVLATASTTIFESSAPIGTSDSQQPVWDRKRPWARRGWKKTSFFYLSVRQIHSSLSESANGHEHGEDENFPMHQQFIPPMIFIIIIIFIIIVIVIITIIITVPAT